MPNYTLERAPLAQSKDHRAFADRGVGNVGLPALAAKVPPWVLHGSTVTVAEGHGVVGWKD